MDISKLAPTEGKGMAPRTPTRTKTNRGPNPFLDNGWLQLSYETGKDYQVTVAGTWEEGVIKKGPQKGQPTERLTGDAADVVYWLREAANKLGIGVSIQYEEPLHDRGAKKGQPIEGQVVIHYLGKTRRQRKTAES